MKKYYFPVLVSLVVSFAFAAIYAYGATTISTSINTGGALTVSGDSTLNGSANTFGDGSTDVNLFTGTLQASTTALFTGVTRHYETLVFYNAASEGTAVEGGVYYNTTSKTLKMYDGINWHTVGTSTSGFTAGGDGDKSIYLSDITVNYLSLGTTTPSGFSILTLAPTTTDSIPLTIKSMEAQAADLFRIKGYLDNNIFVVGNDGELMVATGTEVANSSLTVVSTTTASIPLSIKGVDGQAGNFMQIQDQNGTNLFAINNNGVLNTDYGAMIGTTTQLSGASLIISASSTSAIPLAIKGLDAQAGRYLQVQDYLAADVFFVGNQGNSVIATGTEVANSTLTIVGTTTTSVPLSIKGVDGQSGHYMQVLNDDGTELFVIDEQGVASTTGLSTTGDFSINGFATGTAATGDFATDSGKIGAASSTPFATLSAGFVKDVRPLWIGDQGTSTPSLAIDTNGKLMVGTSSLSANIDIGLNNAATTTIESNGLCLKVTLEDGSNMYMWPCTGATCDKYMGTGTFIGAWATSTTGCNVNN